MTRGVFRARIGAGKSLQLLAVALYTLLAYHPYQDWKVGHQWRL